MNRIFVASIDGQYSREMAIAIHDPIIPVCLDITIELMWSGDISWDGEGGGSEACLWYIVQYG